MSPHSVGGSTPTHAIYLGISVHQWSTSDLLTNLSRYQSLAGKNAAMVMYWRDWAESGQVDPAVMHAIYDQGSVPVVSWEPGSYHAGSGQPDYSLQSIIAGNWDAYIRGFARSLASYRRPVFLRFAHEMNGDWYQWSGQPKEYVAAWRHVYALFNAEGATNVKWVWSPNVNWDDLHPFASYYPGDAYVDWLALDGYNRPRTGWNSFTQIFRVSYQAITALSKKPVMIGETGTAEPTPAEAAAGDSKAQWIMDLYRHAAPSMPRIKAVVWFDVDMSQRDANGTHGYDNRIGTSSGARQAFARAVAPRFYHSRWP
jgi:beta-mannanase